MKPSSFSLFLVAIFCLFISCHHEPSIRGSQFVNGGIAGRVFDEVDVPLSDVQVDAVGSTTTTDVNGNFKLENLQLNKSGVVVKFLKSGYFVAMRNFIPASNSANNTAVKLIKKNAIGNFSAAAGGTVNVPTGGFISFPANSLMNAATNASYNGNAVVSAFFIDPTSNDFKKILPGDLRGVDLNSQLVGLKSLGMMAVEIDGSSGEKLQLAPGKQASISFPIPGAILQQAQSSIPLWYLDETSGLWKQEGTANKVGNTFVGLVSHFTVWNCDYPYQPIQINAIIQDPQHHPLSNSSVYIGTLNTFFWIGATNGDGIFTGFMPINQQAKMFIMGRCAADTIDIGPYAADHDFGVIQSHAINATVESTITGRALNCSGNSIANGFVNISIDGSTNRVNINNGNFSFITQTCTGTAVGQIIAYDGATNQRSEPLDFYITPGTVNVGNMTACTPLNEYINFSIDGVSHLMIADSIDAQVNLGTQTQIFAYNYDSLNANRFELGFVGISPGTYPIDMLKLNVGWTAYVKPDATTMNVFISEFGTVAQYIAGSFSGIVRDTTNRKDVPVTCNFRVRRDQ